MGRRRFSEDPVNNVCEFERGPESAGKQQKNSKAGSRVIRSRFEQRRSCEEVETSQGADVFI